jgi:hypothetical protein
MRFSTLFAVAATLAASAPQALAVIFVTNPVATTTCIAGQPCTVAWQDDGKTPNLASIGPTQIFLSVGSAQQQTNLMEIGAPGVDVSKVNTVTFTPAATLGSNGNFYFIRFQSVSLPDPANPAFKFLGFSAKFTLSGMTGTFNATVQSQISALPASTVAPTSSTPPKPATAPTTPTVSHPASSSGSAASSPTVAGARATNGATKIGTAGAVAGFFAAVLSLAL